LSYRPEFLTFRPVLSSKDSVQFRNSFSLLLLFASLFLLAVCSPGVAETGSPESTDIDESSRSPGIQKIEMIPAPAGFRRVELRDGFAKYLRNLRLLPSSTVYLYNGRPKPNQSAQFRIIDLSVGSRDLQQCADALIRLRAEYLWSANQKEKIQFHFTSGDLSSYAKWRDGYRPSIKGNRVLFRKAAPFNDSRATFMGYLENVFTYAGTISLKMDSVPVADDLRPGDFFLESGSPGHAVMILDMVQNDEGKRLYLLGQSYMPAQQFHVLRNPYMAGEVAPGFESSGPVWYALDLNIKTHTPEWIFPSRSLMRWK